ncbi:MAG: hypothetical protein PHQ54_03555 [Candidatus Omnitrophica bacterium]|nr:hypothetical protein [Candidatus Omnitrophota bacterium]
MRHILLLTWIGMLLFFGAVIVRFRSVEVGSCEIWLEFANTILLISIAISLIHLLRKSS